MAWSALGSLGIVSSEALGSLGILSSGALGSLCFGTSWRGQLLDLLACPLWDLLARSALGTLGIVSSVALGSLSMVSFGTSWHSHLRHILA